MVLLHKEQPITINKETYKDCTNKQLAEMSGLKESTIRNKGYLKSYHKSPEHLSKVRSAARKGKRKHIKPMAKIEKVTKKTEWLRSFKPGQVRTAQLETAKQCHSLSNMVYHWNKYEGFERGIVLHASCIPEKGLVIVTAKAK